MVLPLSANEFAQLRQFLGQLGWVPSSKLADHFRFHADLDKYVSLDAKKAIQLPVTIPQLPFELVSFHFSLLYQIRQLDTPTQTLMNFLATNLRHIGMQSQIEHEINMTGVEQQFMHLCNQVLPEYFDEPEMAWLHKIRISFLNKIKDYDRMDREINAALVPALEELHLEPVKHLPPAFDDQLPKYRRGITLAFASQTTEQDQEDGPDLDREEFFLLEPGFLTYAYDVTFHHVHCRAAFHSYGFYFINEIWKDQGLDLPLLVKAWVQFCRVTMSSLVELISHEMVEKNLLVTFPQRRYVDKHYAETTFPLAPLLLESKMMKTLVPLDNALFTLPPTSFAELRAVELFREAEAAEDQRDMNLTATKAIEALKIFSRRQQKRGILESLLLLARVGRRVKRFTEAQKYLTDALAIAQGLPAAERPLKEVEVREDLGRLLVQINQLDEAFGHFAAVTEILETLREKAKIERHAVPSGIQGRIALNKLQLAKIHAGRDAFNEAKKIFKEIQDYANDDHPAVQIQFALTLAEYHERKGNTNRAMQVLRRVWTTQDKVEDKSLVIPALIEIAKKLLFSREKPAKAAKLLTQAEEYLSRTEWADLPRLVETYELLSDTAKQLKDEEAVGFYLGRAQEIRRTLKIRGWDV